MANHPTRTTRLDDATEIANTVAGLRAPYLPVTPVGDAAHDAAIVARMTAALAVMDTAGRQYAARSGDLSAPSYVRFAERRDVLRQMAHDIKARAAELAAR